MESQFKKKLLAKDKLIGTIVSLPSPEIAELYSSLGFDWLFVDLEHGAITNLEAQRILQASSIPCLLRCPVNEEVWIKKCLDIGADGIIIPQVKNKEDAEKAVVNCMYPPEGNRSVGIARAQGYGAKFTDYISKVNENLSIVIQIEHIDGVNNIKDILQIPEIDCVFVGPYDLSASMNLIGQVDHPDVTEAIDLVTQACIKANMALGIFSATSEGATKYAELGYSLLTVGTETMLLANAAGKILKSLQ